MTTIEKIRTEILDYFLWDGQSVDTLPLYVRRVLNIIDKYNPKEEEWYRAIVEAFEPCEDAVSRQAVLKVYEDRFMELQKAHLKDTQLGVNWCINTLKDMPPVRPQEPKTGHWIKSRDCYGNYHFTCSKCGNDIATQYADNWEDKYCSECGARMVEPQETETWHGIHAQITAPKGTFERIFNDADDEDDI